METCQARPPWSDVVHGVRGGDDHPHGGLDDDDDHGGPETH